MRILWAAGLIMAWVLVFTAKAHASDPRYDAYKKVVAAQDDVVGRFARLLGDALHPAGACARIVEAARRCPAEIAMRARALQPGYDGLLAINDKVKAMDYVWSTEHGIGLEGLNDDFAKRLSAVEVELNALAKAMAPYRAAAPPPPPPPSDSLDALLATASAAEGRCAPRAGQACVDAGLAQLEIAARFPSPSKDPRLRLEEERTWRNLASANFQKACDFMVPIGCLYALREQRWLANKGFLRKEPNKKAWVQRACDAGDVAACLYLFMADPECYADKTPRHTQLCKLGVKDLCNPTVCVFDSDWLRQQLAPYPHDEALYGLPILP